jgi:hypothetical protein
MNTCIWVIEQTEWMNNILKINYYLKNLLTREVIQNLNDYSILEQNYIKELIN